MVASCLGLNVLRSHNGLDILSSYPPIAPSNSTLQLLSYGFVKIWRQGQGHAYVA